MDSNQKSSLQKGKKRKRTTRIEQSEPLSEGSADSRQSDGRTTPSTKKKACFSQTVGQGNAGVQGNRTILEILKMCTPADVLKSLSLLNRQWMETCSSNDLSKELWYTFLEDLCIPFDISTHPKATCAAYLRQQQTVVTLHSDHMDVLNKATGVWTSTKLSAPLPLQNYSYAVLFDGSLLCCGGTYFGREQSDAYQVVQIALDGEVSTLDPMVTQRYWHGITAYGRKVFVFGGVGGFGRPLLTIELYEDSSWSELPTKLNAHHWNFVPAICKGLIYLCDDLSKPIEVFNPQILTVDVLATITIPDHRCNAVTRYEERLVVIGTKNVWRWDSERKEFEVSQKPRYPIELPKMRNVLQGNVLYVITYFKCMMINMKTFRRTYFKGRAT